MRDMVSRGEYLNNIYIYLIVEDYNIKQLY